MSDFNITLTKKQKMFVDSTQQSIDEVFFGGAAGGGKSYVQVVDSVIYASMYPGSKQVLLRRSFPELEHSLIRQFLEIVPSDMYSYNSSKHTVAFKNGSILDFGYCDTDDSVYKYQSQEIDCLRLDEAPHFTEYQYRYLRSRVRGTNKFPHMVKSSGNPGNVGHVFFRERFIEPAPPLAPFEVPSANKKRKPERRLFIPCRVYENKFLMDADPEYLQRLEDLPEDERRQLLEGDWYVFSGQFFSEFRREIHVIDSSQLPKRTPDWRLYTTMDYGLDALAWYLIAENARGEAYVLSEIYESNIIISDAAKLIKERLRDLGITKVDEHLAPSDMWSRRQETGRSLAEIFYENGIMLHKTSRDRLSGWAAVKEWLRPYVPQGLTQKTANLKILNTCVNLVRCLPLLQYDEKRYGDAATIPHEITHCPDALRGFCVYRSRANREKQIPSEHTIREEREYSRFNSGEMFDVYGRKDRPGDYSSFDSSLDSMYG